MQGTTLTAESIEFRERDWRTAVATRAGTTELRQAIIDGNEYVIQEEVTVLFASGSVAIASQYQEQLRAIARNASSHGNYRVSVLGFADPQGDAAANERLSLRRAGAVSNFLRQTGSIEPGRVLSPSAMGEGTTAPGEAAPTSNERSAPRRRPHRHAQDAAYPVTRSELASSLPGIGRGGIPSCPFRCRPFCARARYSAGAHALLMTAG